jgi:hypothetical protein
MGCRRIGFGQRLGALSGTVKDHQLKVMDTNSIPRLVAFVGIGLTTLLCTGCWNTEENSRQEEPAPVSLQENQTVLQSFECDEALVETADDLIESENTNEASAIDAAATEPFRVCRQNERQQLYA